jgi:hypothetical protein
VVYVSLVTRGSYTFLVSYAGDCLDTAFGTRCYAAARFRAFLLDDVLSALGENLSFTACLDKRFCSGCGFFDRTDSLQRVRCAFGFQSKPNSWDRTYDADHAESKPHYGFSDALTYVDCVPSVYDVIDQKCYVERRVSAGIDKTMWIVIAVCISIEAVQCRRRLNFDPPCRLNFDPGASADQVLVGCG